LCGNAGGGEKKPGERVWIKKAKKGWTHRTASKGGSNKGEKNCVCPMGKNNFGTVKGERGKKKGKEKDRQGSELNQGGEPAISAPNASKNVK